IGLGLAAAACAGLAGTQGCPGTDPHACSKHPAQANEWIQFVDTTFKSVCQRPPDPASLNYYWTALNEGAQTPAQVHDAIARTCLGQGAPDPCKHVSGLEDLCGSAAR